MNKYWDEDFTKCRCDELYNWIISFSYNYKLLFPSCEKDSILVIFVQILKTTNHIRILFKRFNRDHSIAYSWLLKDNIIKPDSLKQVIFWHNGLRTSTKKAPILIRSVFYRIKKKQTRLCSKYDSDLAFTREYFKQPKSHNLASIRFFTKKWITRKYKICVSKSFTNTQKVIWQKIYNTIDLF